MEDLPVTSVLSLFDTNKEQRKTFARAVINRIERGTANALNVHIQVKSMEDVIKQIIEDKQYRAFVLEEAAKYPSKRFELGNADIAVSETGIKYDYSQCNDPIYQELAKEQEEAKARLDMRQKFLRNIPQVGMDLLLEGGEVVKVYPPSKTSTTSTVVTLK